MRNKIRLIGIAIIDTRIRVFATITDESDDEIPRKDILYAGISHANGLRKYMLLMIGYLSSAMIMRPSE